MERRKFIAIATVGAATVALPTWYYYRVPKYDQSLARPQLLATIWDLETIAEVGKRYQKQHPDENSERKLVKLLSKSISTENGSIAASLEGSVKEDYKTGKIVTMDGWILSVTEARQCALFALTQFK